MTLFGILLLLLGFLCLYLFTKTEGNSLLRILNLAGGIFGVFTGIMFLIAGYVLIEDSPRQISDVPASELIGKPAEELEFNIITDDTNPQPDHLSAYRDQVVLLNFWATWCAPCVKEMPDLSELDTRYENLTVLCISDEDEETIREFLPRFDADPLQQTIGFLEGSVPEDYDMMRSIRPVSYIIDKDGIIRDVIRGARSLDQFDAAVNRFL